MVEVTEVLAEALPGLAEELATMAERLRSSIVLVRSGGTGGGSGVIWEPNGLVVTNHHVLAGDDAEVVLADGRSLPARVIARDPLADLAALRVPVVGLPAVSTRNAGELRVGELVLAVGNPLGLRGAVTAGIVSAVGRRLSLGGRQWRDVVQADIALQPGNSGGALVDASGRLVGINTAILSRSGGNQGVGFAVPVNLARYVMERILADGKVTRGYLGVMIQPVTAELAKEFKLPDNSGALIGEVTEDSPAGKAGLKAGDVVVEFNGKKVTDSRHLRLMVAQTAPGTKAPLKVIRDGKEETVTVKLAELPAEKGLAKAGDRSGGLRRGGHTDPLDGVTVEDLNARSRREFNIPGHVRGALVTEVDPASAAAAAGLREGDVILEINRQPVTDADEAVRLSERIRGGRVLLRVWSRGGSRYVIVEAGPRGR